MARLLAFNFIHLVVIVDPGIKVDRGYKAYDDGISKGVFVKVSGIVSLYVCVSCVCSV